MKNPAFSWERVFFNVNPEFHAWSGKYGSMMGKEGRTLSSSLQWVGGIDRTITSIYYAHLYTIYIYMLYTFICTIYTYILYTAIYYITLHTI